MRTTRLSLACPQWQETIWNIGPAAAGLLLYLRLTMRNIGSAELTITTEELADALHMNPLTIGSMLCSILDAGLLEAKAGPDGLTTYVCREEAAAIAERFRKQKSSTKRKLANASAALTIRAPKIPEHTLFNQTGNSGEDKSSTDTVRSASLADNNQKEYTCEAAMLYKPQPGEPGRGENSYYFRKKKEKEEHILFDQTGISGQKEKKSGTKENEKSLTERPCAHADTRDVSLPVDALESQYIDVVGSMQESMRTALRNESDDVREAFYLYCRKKRDELESKWGADAMRAAWLSARRIPAERRADSILAAYMGDWKTIRDCGSGCYFEKSTGRVVSLVRGTVEQPKKEAPAAALGFLSRMRRS